MDSEKTPNNNLPGYPHYKASDDITANDKNVDADIEQITTQGGNLKPLHNDALTTGEQVLADGANDITREDLNILGSVDQDMDDGDDETTLPAFKKNDDIMGGDLDVSFNDDTDDNFDNDDEENNMFSRGQN